VTGDEPQEKSILLGLIALAVAIGVIVVAVTVFAGGLAND